MSKLERLNASVAQLLAVAVHEVLDVVGQAVTEYQEETARTRRENDSLKRRLRDLQEVLKRVEGGEAGPGWAGLGWAGQGRGCGCGWCDWS